MYIATLKIVNIMNLRNRLLFINMFHWVWNMNSDTIFKLETRSFILKPKYCLAIMFHFFIHMNFDIRN